MNHRATLRTLPAALAIAGALLAGPAHADWGWNQDTWAQGRAVNVQLRVDGCAAPLYLSQQGDARRYFEAFAGRNYSVVVRNNTGARLGVLISVDGLNVVSGQRSRLSPDEQMYVLGPWETTTIRGWRTSLNDIQRFVFVDEKRSYAERTGQANGDMGWIRVVSFREQRMAWTPRPSYFYNNERNEPQGSRDDAQQAPPMAERRAEPPAATPAPTASGSAREEVVAPQAQGELKAQRKSAADGLARNDQGGSFPGTGWGEHRSDPVQNVEFRATDTLNLRYEYASGLQALGIYRNRDRDRDRLRERDNGALGFAKPPRW
jgi:hypothetical protein